MAFTPEQIAKAYVGPQADIYDAFKDYTTLEAKQNAYEAAQRKLKLEQDRKDRVERNAAMNDLLAAQKANSLATGSQLDPLWNKKTQDIMNDAFSAEGTELYKTNPAMWKARYIPQLHQLNDQMKSVQAGVKKVDEYLKTANEKAGGSLNVPALRTALINTIGLDENNNPRESFNAEESNMNAFLNGAYDPKAHKEIADPRQQAKIASYYYDPEKLKQNILTSFKPDMQEDFVTFRAPNGVKVNQTYKIPQYYKKTNEGIVLDVQPFKGKDNGIYPVASDNIVETINKIPYGKVALANHEKDLLETKAGKQAFENLPDEQWDRYVMADFAKQLKAPEKVSVPGVDAAEQAGFYRNMALMNQRKEGKDKGHLRTVADYVNNPQAALQDFPTMNAEEADVIGAPANASLIRLDAGPQGSKELKTANGSKVNVFLDPNTGQSYMVYRPTMTMAGVMKNPSEAKIGGKDMTNRLIPIPKDRNDFWLKNFNYSQYGDKKEDFPLNNAAAPKTQSAPQTQSSTQVRTQSAPKTAAKVSDDEWGNDIANATQSIKGLGKKGATQIPEALKKKIDNPTSQVASTNNNANEDDEWINTILDFENTKGSRLGKQMLDNKEPNFGYNKHSAELIKIKDLGERKKKAVEYFKKEILPQVKHLPLGVRKMAADLIYNGGQDPRTFLVYAAKGLDSIPEDITERQKYWGGTKDKKEIDKLWNQNKDLVEKQLNDPDFVDKLYKVRKNYYDRLSDKEAYNNSWIYRLDMFKNNK